MVSPSTLQDDHGDDTGSPARNITSTQNEDSLAQPPLPSPPPLQTQNIHPMTTRSKKNIHKPKKTI